jgi:hypothetical protein
VSPHTLEGEASDPVKRLLFQQWQEAPERRMPTPMPPTTTELLLAVGADQAMNNPLWMLVPWLVCALAAGVKFWRLTALFRKHLLGIPSRTERLRQTLERIWQKDQQAG